MCVNAKNLVKSKVRESDRKIEGSESGFNPLNND